MTEFCRSPNDGKDFVSPLREGADKPPEANGPAKLARGAEDEAIRYRRALSRIPSNPPTIDCPSAYILDSEDTNLLGKI